MNESTRRRLLHTPLVLGPVLVVFASLATPIAAAETPPTKAEVAAALLRATDYFHGAVASHGGYVYRYSADLKLREGEGTVDESTIWVQPPGTPAVGEAFLDAWNATGDTRHRDAAHDAGRALVAGQLQSGGWNYAIEFDRERRGAFAYRFDLDGTPLPERLEATSKAKPAGWHRWKSRQHKGNVSTYDDDVTQSATRFLWRLDAALDQQDAAIHDAAQLALAALLRTQYPNGGWSANYDGLHDAPPVEDDYPIVPASYPETWSKTWTKDFAGCYVTNDDLVADMIDTLLLAHRMSGDKAALAAARRAGDFLIAAQMPDPQPAWAQQYDRNMQPCWSRAFEPPAVSGGESQRIIRALLTLAEATGDAKYREPIPRALAYLKASRRPDGRLARFYELKTNRPLYFTRVDGRHELTYDDDRLATGYGYVVDAELDALEAEYERQAAGSPEETNSDDGTALEATVRSILDAQDERGAWVEPGRLQHHRVEPPGGIIDSATFARNVSILCRYLHATK